MGIIKTKYFSPQQGDAFDLDESSVLVHGLRNLLVADPSYLPMRSYFGGYNTLGGYGTVGISKVFINGICMQNRAGAGYVDTSIVTPYSTDAYGVFIFSLFYKKSTASGNVLTAIGPSYSNEGTITLNSNSTLTITANYTYTYTTPPIVLDGINSVVFANYRVLGKQATWLNGVLIDASGNNVEQTGYSSNVLKAGESTLGTFYSIIAGASIGTHADNFAVEFHNNPWNLFKSRNQLAPGKVGGLALPKRNV